MPVFWSMLLNSFLVMLVTTSGVIIICSMATFAYEIPWPEFYLQFSYSGSYVPDFDCNFAGVSHGAPNRID